MPSITRRTLLGAVAAGSAAALAGCSSSCPDSGSPEPDALVEGGDTTRPFENPAATDWSSPRHDAGNTGYAADAALPEAPLGVRWRTSLPADGGDGRPATSAPIVVGDQVLVATTAGVSALSFRDGTEAWRSTAVDPATVESSFDYGETLVPPVAGPDRTVYAAGEDALVALSPTDGSERWRYEAAGPVRTPVVHRGTVYVGSDADLVALDAADGTERWTATVETRTDMPAVADDAVVLAGDGPTVALEAATGEMRWESDWRADGHPVVADGTVYAAGYEGLAALDAADGTDRWTFDRGSGRSLTSPVVTEDSLYVVEKPGEASDAAFALDRTDGPPDPRWCSDTGDAAVTAATADRAVGLLSGSRSPDDTNEPLLLAAFENSLGNTKWALAGRDHLLPPAVVDSAAVVAARDGTVRALGAV